VTHEHSSCSSTHFFAPGALSIFDHSFSSATQLRHLQITSTIATRNISAASWLARLLSSVTSDVLERVDYRLEFAANDYFDLDTWAQITAVIEEKTCHRDQDNTPLSINFVLVGINDPQAREDASVAFESLVRDDVVKLEFREAESAYKCWPGCRFRFPFLPQ
jgi:hypothetical protein